MLFLSIVIPRYRETELQVFPLLASIAGQCGINFNDVEVIIVNDGGGPGPLSENLFSLFPALKIRQVSLAENGGPGLARQAGIEAAEGQYLMFCDADDVLHNVGALGALMQEAYSGVPDLLVSDWLEELPDGKGGFTYMRHENETTWMHGKLLRRSFVLANNIRHHPKLRVHEDSYFLAVASALTNTRRLPVVTYVWKYGPETITRRNGAAYSFESMPVFADAVCLAFDDIRRRNLPLHYRVVQLTEYIYFMTHRPEWLDPAHDGHRTALEQAFTAGIARHWDNWKTAPEGMHEQVYGEERAKHFAGCVERETLDAWLSRLGLES